jgi:hypothetical protein
VDTKTLLALAVCWISGYVARWVQSESGGNRSPVLKFNAEDSIGVRQPDIVQQEEWRTSMQVFVYWGNRLGWSQGKMCGGPRKLMSRTAWEDYAHLLRDEKILYVKPRCHTRWLGDWDLRKLQVCLRHGLLPLPYPDKEPPKIFAGLPDDADDVVRRRHAQPAQCYAELEDWPHLNRGDLVTRGEDRYE